MKKKLIIIFSILLAMILLIPIPMQLKDGGTVEYKAILYKVSDVHSLKAPVSPDDEAEYGYREGIIVEILGFEVFNNVK